MDSRGHTLYMFDLDKGARSACTGACLASWHPFLTSGRPVAAAGIPAAKLGWAKRSNGTLQVMFAGHLLYFFAGDRKAGDVNGASIVHWSAISAAGAKLRAKAVAPPPATTPTTTDPYGGGYGNGGY